MSRTYRRLGGDQSWHNSLIRRWEEDNHGGSSRSWPDLYWGKSLQKELAQYHGDTGWSRNTPSWWIRQFMTRPQRQQVRQLSQKVLQMPIGELIDCPLYPLAKKPHHYYW